MSFRASKAEGIYHLQAGSTTRGSLTLKVIPEKHEPQQKSVNTKVNQTRTTSSRKDEQLEKNKGYTK